MSALKSLIGAAVVVVASTSAAQAMDFRFNREALSYSSGAASTARSLERFAEDACGLSAGNYIGPRKRIALRKCKREVTDEIVAKIGDSRLEAAVGQRAKLASR